MAQRFEGRNVEEALDAAAEGLGAERHQIMHRVLVEKRGFLGGMKRVVIEAEVNEDAAPPKAPESAADVVTTPAPAPAPRVPAAGGPAGRAGRGGGRGRPRDGRGSGRREGRSGGSGGRGERRQQQSELHPGDFAQFISDELPPQEPEGEAALVVRAWCDKVLSLARFDVVLRTRLSAERIDVTLFGPDCHRFLDHNGELLDALQVLANKALVGRKVEQEIELDCAGFKGRREESIVRHARDAAERVREDGVEQLLPAMAPAERRIVHVSLQDDPDVATISRGEGFYKRVAVIPKAAGTDPEP